MSNSKYPPSALSYIKLKQNPLFEIIDDPDPNLGKTLIGKRDLPKHSPVVIYYGKTISTDENLKSYLDDPENYLRNKAPFIRAHPIIKDLSIDASEVVKNSSIYPKNAMGVLVNDLAKPKSLEIDDLREYHKSAEECNLMAAPFPTKDFPLYITRRKIKKGETLTVHYGLPYWLLSMGVHPAEIGDWLEMIRNE